MDVQEILKLTYELKDELKNTKEYLDVVDMEKQMLEDNDTFILLNSFEEAKEEYNQALRFKDYDSNYLAKQQELSQVKLKVDNNPFVIKYKKAYRKYNDLLKEIEKTIFNGIIEKNKGSKKCV